jgi:hypothetical protein
MVLSFMFQVTVIKKVREDLVEIRLKKAGRGNRQSYGNCQHPLPVLHKIANRKDGKWDFVSD